MHRKWQIMFQNSVFQAELAELLAAKEASYIKSMIPRIQIFWYSHTVIFTPKLWETDSTNYLMMQILNFLENSEKKFVYMSKKANENEIEHLLKGSYKNSRYLSTEFFLLPSSFWKKKAEIRNAKEKEIWMKHWWYSKLYLNCLLTPIFY